MRTFQHKFPDVRRYLHHRPPYLMVDRIVSINPHQIVTEKNFSGNEFFVPGHFPGAAIMPGAMMQEVTTQSAGILIAAEHNPMQQFDTTDPVFNEFALGVLMSVRFAKFKGFARPGDTICANVTLNEVVGNLFDFSAVINVGPQTIMRNSFRLSNIESRLLQG